MTGITATGRLGLAGAKRALPTKAVPLTACVATVAGVAPTVFSAPPDTRSAAIPVFVFGVAVLFGLGLSDLLRGRDSLFATAVVAAGMLWSLSALATSTNPTLYSIGRMSQWLVDVALVYLLLAYPSGRLANGTDQALFAGIVLTAGLLWLPSALVVQHFPTPGVWSSCTTACPGNAFAIGHSTPWAVDDLVVPFREAITVSLFLAATAVIIKRAMTARPLEGGLYVPIAFIAFCRALLLGVFFVTRRVAPDSSALQVLMWAYVLSLPAVGLAAIAGRLYRRLVSTTALEELTRDLGATASPSEVTRALAAALKDPSLRILHSFAQGPAGWVDESGTPVTLPRTGIGHHVTGVSNGGWRIAIVHDPALAEHAPLVETAGSYALAALEKDHLSRELRSSLQELLESRARGIAAEDREREKIERDLHDGAQQRLIAVRVKLELAAEQIAGRAPSDAELVRSLAVDIDATIDEVRSFARGIYPPLLAKTGLGEALRAAGREAALPTIVEFESLERYAPEIEKAVYFACTEAVQNAAKHARGATGVTISLWQSRELRFDVHDDGAGFDVRNTPYGTGLGNVRDRLAAVGGTITIQSARGLGTRVAGSIPV
jgi:signal transduction histidine kinase